MGGNAMGQLGIKVSGDDDVQQALSSTRASRASKPTSASTSATATGIRSPRKRSTCSPRRPVITSGSMSIPEKAAAGPYGKTIAHGYLTLSLVPILVQQIYKVTGLSMQVNYGVDKLRFPAPVPVDSRIRAGAELVKVERNDKGARATVRVTVEVEGSDRPACVVDTIAAMVS